MIRLALLDDHPLIRTGLGAIIATQHDLQLVGSATDESELWPLLERTRPAVLILDYHHPGRDGLALCLQVKLGFEPPAVVLYSAYAPETLQAAAAVAGADALVSKIKPSIVVARSSPHGRTPPPRNPADHRTDRRDRRPARPGLHRAARPDPRPERGLMSTLQHAPTRSAPRKPDRRLRATRASTSTPRRPSLRRCRSSPGSRACRS